MAIFDKNKQVRTPRFASRRSPVNTYYRAGTKANELSPFIKKQPKHKLRKLVLGFFDVILLVILVIGLAYSAIIKPVPILRVNDTTFHKFDEYQLAVKAQLQQLKNRNKITFDEPTFAAALQQKFPEISAVNVELPIFSEQPKITLTVANPSFQLSSRGANYIINSSGVAVAKSASLPSANKLVMINDQSGFYVNLGSQVLSAEDVSFINTLIAECHYAHVTIVSLTLPRLAQELDLRTSDQPYYVKFYLGGDALTQTGQFLAARHNFAQSGQPPGQYLDVRITGKIFYK